MSDSEQNGSSQNTEEQAEVQAERAEPAEPAEQRAPTLEDKLAEAQAEAARTREQLLRTAADFDNFRKRSRREVEEAQRRGRESILKDLLPVFDNLERAASHAENAPDVKSVAEGVRIVAKQFVDTLDRMGIKRIPAVGKPFDPSVHEAIQQIESTEHPAGVVIAEVQPGYILGDYLIRAAMVVVSKGSPGGESSTSEAN
ncbi:nucleotide exchange factor GrpE [Sorangium sp. So ce1335]|uniref:nucleotide exchange factor GrpE n=1 Tax=Sorangium sp. So ce1335 TaxID=3133335 RepID=UPI003F60280E